MDPDIHPEAGLEGLEEASSIRRGTSKQRWTIEEHNKLTEIMQRVSLHQTEEGRIKWAHVAAELGTGRTSKQCRERWVNSRPELKKGPWETAEEDRLAYLHATEGPLWATFSKDEILRFRSENATKTHWHTLMRAKSFIGRPTNALTAYMALIKAGRPPNTDTLSLAHRLVGSVIRALCQRHYKGPNLATALDIALSREVLGPDIPADDAVAALECILAQPQPQTSQGTGQSSGDAASGSTSKGPGGAAFSALLGFGGSASSKLARTRSEPPAVVESNDPDAVPMGVDTPSLAGAADTARARSAHELAAQAQLPGTATAQGNAAGAGAAAGSFTAQLLGGPSQWQSDRASAVSALLSQRSLPAPARRATFTAGAAGTPVRRVRPADALGSLTSPRLRTAGPPTGHGSTFPGPRSELALGTGIASPRHPAHMPFFDGFTDTDDVGTWPWQIEGAPTDKPWRAGSTPPLIPTPNHMPHQPFVPVAGDMGVPGPASNPQLKRSAETTMETEPQSAKHARGAWEVAAPWSAPAMQMTGSSVTLSGMPSAHAPLSLVGFGQPQPQSQSQSQPAAVVTADAEPGWCDAEAALMDAWQSMLLDNEAPTPRAPESALQPSMPVAAAAGQLAVPAAFGSGISVLDSSMLGPSAPRRLADGTIEVPAGPFIDIDPLMVCLEVKCASCTVTQHADAAHEDVVCTHGPVGAPQPSTSCSQPANTMRSSPGMSEATHARRSPGTQDTTGASAGSSINRSASNLTQQTVQLDVPPSTSYYPTTLGYPAAAGTGVGLPASGLTGGNGGDSETASEMQWDSVLAVLGPVGAMRHGALTGAYRAAFTAPWQHDATLGLTGAGDMAWHGVADATGQMMGEGLTRYPSDPALAELLRSPDRESE